MAPGSLPTIVEINDQKKKRWEKQTKQFQYVSHFELLTVDKINPECMIVDITL